MVADTERGGDDPMVQVPENQHVELTTVAARKPTIVTHAEKKATDPNFSIEEYSYAKQPPVEQTRKANNFSRRIVEE